MTKVVRLKDETTKLLDIFRDIVKKDFNDNGYDMAHIISQDNIIIQIALMTAIENRN